MHPEIRKAVKEIMNWYTKYSSIFQGSKISIKYDKKMRFLI